MDSDAFVALFLAHKWLAASSVVVGLLVRLAKAGKLGRRMADIPPRLRPVLAVAFGFLTAATDVLATGGDPAAALARGIGAAAFAVFGHDLLIESAREGREIGAKK